MPVAIKPPFIDGISTKGVQIYQLKSGEYRYRVLKKSNRGLDTDIATYSNLKEAADAQDYWREHGELPSPTNTYEVAPTYRRKTKKFNPDYDDADDLDLYERDLAEANDDEYKY